MWHSVFFILGRIARLMVRTGQWGLLQTRSQERRSGFGKRGHGGKPLARLTGLADHRVAGAVVAAAVETSRALLNRPSVRVSVEAAVLKLLRGTGEPSQIVEPVRDSALRIALLLQERGCVPQRIAVDGLPGSGKSSLARALADRLGLKWKSLDHENMNVPRDFSREHTVYEHHRLLRTQNVDHFDVIVYADEFVTVSKTRVLQRARTETRAGLMIDMLDYEKLQKIGNLAFRVCRGELIPIPGTRLLVKIRPPAGFGATENLVSRLRAAGYDLQNLEKEEMLFLLLYGKRQCGLRAYFLPGAYTEEFLQGLVAGMREYFAE